MKSLAKFLVLSLFVALTFSFNNTDTNSTNKSTFTPVISDPYLHGIRQYTLEMAEAMPADKYTFRPTDSVKSFGEQLAHIASSSKFFLDIFVEGKPMPTQEDFEKSALLEKEIGKDKQACINSLKKTFDAVDAAYASMSPEDLNETFTVFFDPNQPKFPKSRAFEFIKDHLIHHRGQALVSLRMQGIPAPSFKLY